MERSQSVPATWSIETGNPWYSEKAKAECALAANRPVDLPGESGDEGKPVQNGASGLGSLPSIQFGVTGKGRGGSATGMLGSLQPTEYGNSRMMSEGEMPRESDSLKTMGMVRNQRKVQQHGSPDGLQRALEGEMVNMLRQQNSKLMDELQFLRAKREKGSMGKPASGMESSSGWVGG